MPNSHKRKLFLGALLLAMVMSALMVFSTGLARNVLWPNGENQREYTPQSQQENTGKRESNPNLSDVLATKSKHSARPAVGEFGEAPVESQQDKERRKIREDLYPLFLHERLLVADPGTKEVNGQSESINLTFEDGVRVLKPGERPDPPGLPISCTTIVIGTVQSGKAFVSDSRALVYSDYQTKISEILKPDASRSIEPGSEIITWRRGGSIHFPSGHTQHFILNGEGFPEIGTQYIFFLWRTDPRLREYLIGTAYAIKGTVVLPLDEGSSHTAFDGMPVSDFLASLQNALTTARTGGQ